MFFPGYSFADLLSNMVKWDHIKDQLTWVLSDGTVTQGFNKSNESPYPFLFSFRGDFHSNILREFSFEFSFAHFPSNFLSQVSFKYSFADFLSNILSHIFEYSFADFLSNIVSMIFFRIFLRGFSFEYFYADFLSNILSRIFFRIIFRGFSF